MVKLIGKVMCVVFMGPAGRKAKEAFSWKTISTSRGGQIHFSNLDSVWFKEVYEKWVKRHQKCNNYAGEYFEKE